jgi:hypothetical protein
MNESILSLLRKVKELAERGVDGERDAAAAKLVALMRKYKIKPVDLESQKVVIVRFKYRTMNEKILGICLAQVTCGRRDVDCRVLPRKTILIYMTKAQKLEWQSIYSHYVAALRKDMALFIAAFFHRQGIQPPPGEGGKDLTPEEISAILKMMGYIERSPYVKMGSLIRAYDEATEEV